MSRRDEWACLHGNVNCEPPGVIVAVGSLDPVNCSCRPVRRQRRLMARLGSVLVEEQVMVDFDRTPIKDLPPGIQRRLRAYVGALADYIEGPRETQDEEAFARAEQRRGAGLWFTGGNGTGKTSAAMLIAKKAHLAGYSVQGANTTFTEILGVLRRSHADDSTETLTDTLKHAQLLVLDDMGAFTATPFAMDELFKLIEFRTKHRLPTIVTTDRTQRELVQHLGGEARDPARARRIISRLYASCGKPIEFGGDGVDHRIARPFDHDADVAAYEREVA
jgi:hypothetical protein